MNPLKNRFFTTTGILTGVLGMVLSGTLALADDMGGGMGDMNGMSNMSSGMGSSSSSPAVGHGKGVVKSLDTKAGTVTITHGPIKEFGWKGMTMAFSVKHRSFLSSLKKGEQVQFDVIQDNNGPVITKIEERP
jgi:Cu/Ag efflux protein CusF